jgi:hypothetical protein
MIPSGLREGGGDRLGEPAALQVVGDDPSPRRILMEDYDIDRSGYHDSRDTMAGTDLHFGAGLAAVAIEAVARAAGAGVDP